MRIIFKLTKDLLQEVHASLRRPHPFAFERVGFLLCRVGAIEPAGAVILAHRLHAVADEDYVDEPAVGAMMGPDAIRKALQIAYSEEASMFHVHLHLHSGRPRFSQVDETESAKFVPDFWNVQPNMPHGALVFSSDSAFGRCWIPGQKKSVEVSDFKEVGVPMRKI
jgi:hypothetical protein